MAQKTVIMSDLSGTELDDATHTRVQVKHPDQSALLELDISAEEADKLANTTLRLIEFTVFQPGHPPRTAVMESKVADKVFPNLEEALAGARKVQASSTPVKRGARASTGSPDVKVNYTDADRYGQLHRGRLTDEEKELVKANRDQASANRKAQTGKDIDWNDPAEIKRYGL